MQRRAFTLIELLIVMGIIVALAGLLLPAIHNAYFIAERSAIASDLQLIGNALEAYRSDFGDYPRPGGASKFQPDGVTVPVGPVQVSGPQILCWALIAPGPKEEDGADGPGFRIRGTTGRVYGPYLPPDRFVIGNLSQTNRDDAARVIPYSDSGKQVSDNAAVLADRRGRVILYYPAHKAAHPDSRANSYVAAYWRPPAVIPPNPPQNPPLGWAGPIQGRDNGPNGNLEGTIEPRWNVVDGPAYPMLIPAYLLRQMVGAAPEGSVAQGKMPIDAPYLLISAGTAAPVAGWNPDMKQNSSQGGSPDPFGQGDNVANVPLYTPSRSATQ